MAPGWSATAHYVTFQLAAVAVSRVMFTDIPVLATPDVRLDARKAARSYTLAPSTA